MTKPSAIGPTTKTGRWLVSLLRAHPRGRVLSPQEEITARTVELHLPLVEAEAAEPSPVKPGSNGERSRAFPAALRGDGPCADCGTLDNIVWFTDNVFWNAVTGEGVVAEEARGAILCIPCFVTRTERAGYRPTGWRLLPEWKWEGPKAALRACDYCGTPFRPKRSDGRFCTHRCRWLVAKRAQRARAGR